MIEVNAEGYHVPEIDVHRSSILCPGGRLLRSAGPVFALRPRAYSGNPEAKIDLE